MGPPIFTQALRHEHLKVPYYAHFLIFVFHPVEKKNRDNGKNNKNALFYRPATTDDLLYFDTFGRGHKQGGCEVGSKSATNT